MPTRATRTFGCLALLLFCTGLPPAPAAEPERAILELQKRGYVFGREYFVLRSGRTELIIQSDRVDLGPALSYLIFDAERAAQSRTKDGAFNFEWDRGHLGSAVEVSLGGFAFTALGHRTDVRWVVDEGIPAAEGVWWAGGIRVRERTSALAGVDGFQRRVLLEGAHLVGEESVTLRLRLPSGPASSEGCALLHDGPLCRLAIVVAEGPETRFLVRDPQVEIGPLGVAPGAAVTVETALFAQIPRVGGPEGMRELAERAETWRRSAGREALLATRAAWAATSRIETRDELLSGIFDRARFGLAGMVADDGTMNAGIFEYGAQWVRDTSNTILGAIHAGHFALAKSAFERMLGTMVTEEGVTMIGGGFDSPDLEQFDQMGELLHALKSYRDWTGDTSLLGRYRVRLLAMIERPLAPAFRDETGMVHNRREYWERSFEDAYELAYQTWVIQGLRDAAAMAEDLGALDRAPRWRAEAERIRGAMLSHPTRALVEAGRLIKRRNVTGTPAVDPAGFRGSQADVPLVSERAHRIVPDATQALPIALGIVDPRSALARSTLEDLEALWNTRWSDGGYDRYHTSSQPDQPGPWPFATCFILRAEHESGLYERSRRSLEWLGSMQGGRTGAWFEEIPSVRSQAKPCGLLPWTSGEIALFAVRHVLGIRFDDAGSMLLRPALYPGSPPVAADLRFRKGRLRIEVDGAGPIRAAFVDGVAVAPDADGYVRVSPDFAGGKVVLRTR